MSDTQEKANKNQPSPQVNDEIAAAIDEPAAGNGQDPANADLITRLKQELDDAKDQLLRARAEFVNYQKRAKQQADNDRVYSVGSLARDLLDPLDNLERAIDALRTSAAPEIAAGLDMVQKQLLEVLGKHGVEPIRAHGKPFDPNLHDALLQLPSDEHPEGTVVAEHSKGYTIRDRVLRPSKVSVSVKRAREGE
jgi:molecular chaperone GrpE